MDKPVLGFHWLQARDLLRHDLTTAMPLVATNPEAAKKALRQQVPQALVPHEALARYS